MEERFPARRRSKVKEERERFPVERRKGKKKKRIQQLKIKNLYDKFVPMLEIKDGHVDN